MIAPGWAAGHCAYPLRAFRHVFRRIDKPAPPNAEIVTAYTDGVVTLRRNRRLDGYHEASSTETFKWVRAGDFVVHGLDILRGSIGISDSDGAISPVCIVCRPLDDNDPRYFAYVIRAQAWSGYTRAAARGVREGGADFRRWDTLGELQVPVPDAAHQRGIADFLDAETARIEALIARKRRVVELLRERFRAEVTARTNRGARLPIRRITSLITSGPRGWSERIIDDGVAFIRSGDLQKESVSLSGRRLARVPNSTGSEAARCRVEPGDTVVGITGANMGWVGIVEKTHVPGFVSQHVGLLRPRDIVPRWLTYSVFAKSAQEQLLAGQYGGTKQQLSLYDLAELRVNVPTIGEQRALAAELDYASLRYSQATEKLDQQIRLLQEHRQALITSAVTGQLAISGT